MSHLLCSQGHGLTHDISTRVPFTVLPRTQFPPMIDGFLNAWFLRVFDLGVKFKTVSCMNFCQFWFHRLYLALALA